MYMHTACVHGIEVSWMEARFEQSTENNGSSKIIPIVGDGAWGRGNPCTNQRLSTARANMGMCCHPVTPTSPVPPCLLPQNLSPKVIAGFNIRS